MRNLNGRVFERLTVIGLTPLRKHKEVVWLCRCECNSICLVLSGNLVSGHTKSCGCLQRENTSKANKANLANIKFGKLFVVEQAKERNSRGNVVWSCLCECGNTKEVVSFNLSSGRTKSCGCLVSETAKKNFTTHGLTGTKFLKTFLENKRRAAKLKRTPVWADLDAIREFYKNCPEDYEVDHNAPLQGKLISGLHVLENLQYLHKDIHKYKINKFTSFSIDKAGKIVYFDKDEDKNA